VGNALVVRYSTVSIKQYEDLFTEFQLSHARGPRAHNRSGAAFRDALRHFAVFCSTTYRASTPSR